MTRTTPGWKERLPSEDLIRIGAFALSAVVVGYFTWRTIGYRLDDALIYARYARNFVAGHGLVYNPGERHNAISSPLFVWLLAGAGALGGNIPVIANAIGGLCTVATVYLLVFELFPRDDSPLIGAAAGLLYATANMNFLTFGMESPVLILLLTGMLAAYRWERWMAFSVLVGLAGVTRAEAVFLAAPLYVGVWLRMKSVPWRLAMVSLAVMLPFFLFNQLFYGHVFADTLAAKIHQGQSGFWGTRRVFLGGAKGILLEWYIGLPVLPITAGLSALPFITGRAPQLAWWVAGFVGALLCFYSLLPVPAYHWYLLPLIWAFCILAPLGVAAAYRWIEQKMAAARWAVLLLGAAGVAATLYAHGRKLAVVETGPNPPYFRIARWLNDHTPGGTSLGAAEIGHLGWYTNRYMVDMVGLISAGNSGFLARRDVDGWLRKYHPEYIVIHTPPWPVEEGAIHALKQNRYAVEEGLTEPGYQLLGPPGARARPGSSGEQ